MPPKASKRTQTEPSNEPTPANEGNKKPRLDLQEQIKRASTLAAQLRDGVKDDADFKNSAANQIATEELTRIFESMQEKTNDKLENCDGSQDGNLSYELERYLFPPGLKSSVATRITKAAQKKMESVSSGNIAAEAKKAAESAITEEFQKGINKQLLGLMQ